LALSGVSTNVLTSEKDPTTATDVPANNQNAQTVEMHVTSSGFSPATLTVKKGVPVRWVIKGDAVTGCTSKIIVPSLNISQNINQGDNVITFTPTQTGDIPFSCWMGMVRGKFIVQ
jgi:plastocyanin domain-containing protein